MQCSDRYGGARPLCGYWRGGVKGAVALLSENPVPLGTLSIVGSEL